MIIYEEKFAAAIRLKNGEAKRFDDIGCMIDYLNKNKVSPKSNWVYDYINKEPIHAEDAFFVDSDNLITPMGFGIAALKSNDEALKIADEFKSKIISFNELKNKYHKSKTE